MSLLSELSLKLSTACMTYVGRGHEDSQSVQDEMSLMQGTRSFPVGNRDGCAPAAANQCAVLVTPPTKEGRHDPNAEVQLMAVGTERDRMLLYLTYLQS
jgi:hypothetical protein